MSNSYLKNIFKQTVYKNYLNQKGNFTYYGEKVFFPKNSTTFKLAMRDGIYEHEILKFIQSNIKDHSTYIDVGANIGLMSIPVLAMNTSIKVLSLEASPNTFNFLKQTRDNCSFKERWSIYNKAVSNSNKEIDLFITSNSDGAFESIMDTRRVSFSGTVKVPGITIDELWASLNKPAVSFIKSDIEGALTTSKEITDPMNKSFACGEIAAALVKNGDLSEAGKILLQIGNSSQEAEAYRQAGEAIIETGHAEELSNWLEEIPSPQARAYTCMGAVDGMMKLAENKLQEK